MDRTGDAETSSKAPPNKLNLFISTRVRLDFSHMLNNDKSRLSVTGSIFLYQWVKVNPPQPGGYKGVKLLLRLFKTQTADDTLINLDFNVNRLQFSDKHDVVIVDIKVGLGEAVLLRFLFKDDLRGLGEVGGLEGQLKNCV